MQKHRVLPQKLISYKCSIHVTGASVYKKKQKKNAWNSIYMNGVLSTINVSKKKSGIFAGTRRGIPDISCHLCVTDAPWTQRGGVEKARPLGCQGRPLMGLDLGLGT